MQNFKAYGAVDYLPKAKKIKNNIEKGLLSLFEKNFYQEVEPSILAPYSLYKNGVGKVEDNLLFKISDTDGGLLVLRNDITLPISRIVTSSLDISNKPIRLCYCGSSFTLSSEINRLREFSQVGIELFNVDNYFGDVEVIILAIDALERCGIKDFQIDIGQVGIIKGILKNKNLSDIEMTEIISLIDKKNIISESYYKVLDKDTVKLLNNITALYGGKEVLNTAKKILNNEESLNALVDLVKIHEVLENLGLDHRISFDLGLVNSFSYYSGVVFKGITSNFGAPILGGGRYDDLIYSNFGKKLSATGFAIGINDILKALEKQGYGEDDENCKVALVLDDDNASFEKSIELKKSYINEGFCVETLYNGMFPQEYDKVIYIKKGEVLK